MMINPGSSVTVMTDLVQSLYMQIYVAVNPLPYLFMQAVNALQSVNFTFFPKLWTNPDSASTTARLLSTASTSYSNFQADTTFLGNCHPFVFSVGIFSGIYLITWLLTLSCNKIKCFRKLMKKVFRGRMRYGFFH